MTASTSQRVRELLHQRLTASQAAQPRSRAPHALVAEWLRRQRTHDVDVQPVLVTTASRPVPPPGSRGA